MPQDQSLGLLEVELVETIPAFALKELTRVFDDLYFSHLWLDLAGEEGAPAPFPDEYSPTEEETLYISRLEIGTPNYMELLGLGEPLFWVFAFVGGFAGIAAGIERTVKVVDGVYSIIQRHIDIRQKRLALKKALAEAEEQGRVTSLPVVGAPSQADIAYRAERLGGRVSPEALRHKIEQSHDLQATAAYVLPRYCRSIRLYQVR